MSFKCHGFFDVEAEAKRSSGSGQKSSASNGSGFSFATMLYKFFIKKTTIFSFIKIADINDACWNGLCWNIRHWNFGAWKHLCTVCPLVSCYPSYTGGLLKNFPLFLWSSIDVTRLKTCAPCFQFLFKKKISTLETFLWHVKSFPTPAGATREAKYSYKYWNFYIGNWHTAQ